MIKIISSQIAASAVKKSQYPSLILPEIALIGRSNSGKSSLINTLINRRNLARTSSAPGKTRLINFYEIKGELTEEKRQSWYFVDLPGYGYAKVSRRDRDAWLAFTEEYLQTAPERKYCWQLVDIRHAPSVEDIAMHEILTKAGYKLLVIANKADKISKNARAKQLKTIAAQLAIPTKEILIFSAVTGEGKDQLLAEVKNHVNDVVTA